MKYVQFHVTLRKGQGIFAFHFRLLFKILCTSGETVMNRLRIIYILHIAYVK